MKDNHLFFIENDCCIVSSEYTSGNADLQNVIKSNTEGTFSDEKDAKS